MRYFVFILLFLIITVNGHQALAQKQDMLKDSVIKTTDLGKEQWKAWDSISDYWLKNVFPVCLKNNKLKLSCSGCESIYMVVNLYIGADAKLLKYEIVKEKMCGSRFSPALKNCFLDYFQNLEFPESLRGLNIQAHIGNGLKC